MALISPTSSLSAHEQRLDFARKNLPSFLNYAENVPRWPSDFPTMGSGAMYDVTSYEAPQGSAPLIKAICHRERRRHGIALNPREVLVTNGALHALGLIFHSLGGPGTSIIGQSPMFRSIADQAISLQMDMQLVQTDLVKGLDTAPANISGSGPTLLYIALPHSPSGWIPTKETYKQLAEWSVTQGAPIVVDMVYDDFLPDRTTVLHPMHFELGLEDLYIVNSVSKNYGAPGARIGWIASSESNIERLTSLLEQQCIAVSSSSQGYAAELLAVDNGPLREVVERGRKAIMTTELALDLRITGSTAGVQCVFECADVPVADLADHLLRNYGLLVATSENYAQLADSVEFVRLPLGYPEDVVRTASALIQRGYLDLRGDLR